MNNLSITRIVAPQSLTCFQCLNLGLPPDDIATGETCLEIATDDAVSFACEDCFERLSLEVEKIQTEEGE